MVERFTLVSDKALICSIYYIVLNHFTVVVASRPDRCLYIYLEINKKCRSANNDERIIFANNIHTGNTNLQLRIVVIQHSLPVTVIDQVNVELRVQKKKRLIGRYFDL